MYKFCVFGVITCVLLEPVFSYYKEAAKLMEREDAFAKKGKRTIAYVIRYGMLKPEQGRRQVPYVSLPDESSVQEEIPVAEALSAMEPGQRVPVVFCERENEFMIRPEKDCKPIADRICAQASRFRKSSLILLGVAMICLATMLLSLPM